MLGDLLRYLSGQLSVEQLEHDLPDGAELDEEGDRDARRMTLRTMGLLAELHNGDITEDVFRTRIEEMALWGRSRVPEDPSLEDDLQGRVVTAVSFGVGKRPSTEPV